jgi:hypothetical protein
MTEPETDISLRAAQVAADVTEAEQPQERRRLVTSFAKAASSGARAAGRGTRVVRTGAGQGRSAVRRRANAGTGYLVAQVITMAPRLRVRDQAALQARFPGQTPDEISDALIEGAAHASAAAGGAAGVASVLPVLPAFPAEVVAETLVVVGIEIKLVAELHEAYGTRAPGKLPERMSAYLAAWAHRRGVSMIPGGVIFAAGSPLTRPLLTGAAAGAILNGRETRKLGNTIRNDLRRRVLTGPDRPGLD